MQKPFLIKKLMFLGKMKTIFLKIGKIFAVGADIYLGLSKSFGQAFIGKMFRVIRLLKF